MTITKWVQGSEGVIVTGQTYRDPEDMDSRGQGKEQRRELTVTDDLKGLVHERTKPQWTAKGNAGD